MMYRKTLKSGALTRCTDSKIVHPAANLGTPGAGGYVNREGIAKEPPSTVQVGPDNAPGSR